VRNPEYDFQPMPDLNPVAGVLRTALRGAGAALLLFAAMTCACRAQQLNGGPYVPTPMSVLEQMLAMADVKSADFVIDLGSGDGRLVREAVKRFGARGFGVDIDPELVKLSNELAAHDQIADRAVFYERDLFDTDIRKASVLTLYLLPVAVRKLRAKILDELAPGTRVVSHDYYMDDWQADNQITFDVLEKIGVTGTPQTTVYLWIVPARAAGRWQVRAGNEVYEITLKQEFQMLSGTVAIGGRAAKLRYATLRGDEIGFGIGVPGKPAEAFHRFTGRISGDRIEGSVDFADGLKQVRFSASRVGPPGPVSSK